MYNIYQHFQRSNRPSLAYAEADDDYMEETHHDSYYDYEADWDEDEAVEEDFGPDPLRLKKALAGATAGLM